MSESLRSLIRDSISDPNTLVLSSEEAKELPESSSKGIPRSLMTDAAKSRQLVLRIAQHHIRNVARKILDVAEHENPENNEAATLMAPGYFGPNAYLRNLAKTLTLPALRHPHFDQIRLRGNLEQEAQYYYELLTAREAPAVVVAHSRGGPTVLKMLKKLQDNGEDHKVHAVVLIAPISHGVRTEIAQIAKLIPMPTIQEMCPGSPKITDWKSLSQTNRAKVVTISAHDGDVFTSKENGLVEGGTLVVIPCHDGHLQQCLDRESLMFQTAVQIINVLEQNLLDQSA